MTISSPMSFIRIKASTSPHADKLSALLTASLNKYVQSQTESQPRLKQRNA